MKLAIGQFNATVGDIQHNVDKMRNFFKSAKRNGADLLLFPELGVCGYPPEDLLFKLDFPKDSLTAVDQLARDLQGLTAVAGFAEPAEGSCRNSAAVLRNGRVEAIYRKAALPNYGVFDERRYFDAGQEPVVFELEGLRIVVTICYDIWNIEWLKSFLEPVGEFDLLVNISASPFHVGKIKKRQKVISAVARQFNCAVAYCNLIGGQDEIIFDGRSMLADSKGRIAAGARAFEEDLLIADIVKADRGDIKVEPSSPPAPQPRDEIDEIHQALVLGTRDYTRKNGFSRTMLGLSGGIDSSVVAAIAVEALGPESVVGITMPSRFNTSETRNDAKTLAENLGIEFHTVAIEPVLEAFHGSLSAIPGWDDKGIAYENLQARIRGCILMSLSNQFGALVFTTGNKSETAVGYTTLYGDTAGGFAVIKDVPKTIVYEIARRINDDAGQPVIPEDVITRPPSAELRADQKDTDSLPDYDLLDRILKGYVELDKSPRELITESVPADVVHKVIRMVDRNEYKRRLSPPGIKITPKAFGKDRRLPITNRYRYRNSS